jgi:ABC-type dipeptide/oligopeptide/nickel transport system permease component
LRYLLRRVAYAVLVLFLASLVTFFSLRVTPGDVTGSIVNLSTTPPEVVAQLKDQLGLNLPLWQQYWNYLSGMFTGDLGVSLVTKLPVTTLIANSASYTIVLALSAFLVAFGLGVPIGVVAALNRGGWLDRGVLATASFFLAIPNFVLALVAVLLFGLQWHLLPVSGASSWKNLILPALVLAAEPCALTVRVGRTAVLEQLSADYTRTLWARGVRRVRIHWVHVLRNSLSPIISLGSIQIRTLLGYTLIVEVIFRWPGLGTQLVNSILHRDYPVAQALALLLAAVVIVSSALTDVVYRWADPRVRLSGSEAA